MRSIDRRTERDAVYADASEVETYVKLSGRSTMQSIEKRFVAAILKGFGHRENLSILDVGTGPGWIPIYLAKARPDWKITAIDASELMLERAQRRALEEGVSVNWLVGNAGRLPFESGSFDLVISHLAYHEFPDPQAAASEMKRVLAPRGSVYLQDIERPPHMLAPFLFLSGALYYLGSAQGKEQYYDSMRASFTKNELANFFSEGDIDCKVRRTWTPAGPFVTLGAARKVGHRFLGEAQPADEPSISNR
jgi:ubiquinone/menaquinone biosynthesis C-methylase UbiE